MKLFTLLFFFVTTLSIAQTAQYQITYTEKYNGKETNLDKKIVVFADEKQTLITTSNFNNSDFPKQRNFINTQDQTITTEGYLAANRMISMIDSSAIAKQNWTLTNETALISGYKAKKATTSINSNRIDIWLTNELPVNAAPNTLGIKLGTVLRYVRNNDYVIEVSSVKKLKKKELVDLKPSPSQIVDGLVYQDLMMKARYQTISIFKDEIISFNETNTSNDSIFKYANGTVAVRKIKFPKIEKGSLVFLDVKQQANGDAYDRTGSVFAILPSNKTTFLKGLQEGINTLPLYDNGSSKKYQGVVSTENYETTLELMRFFTSFGVHHFNYIKQKDKDWRDWSDFRQDISEFNETFSEKEIYIGIFIGNYDKGGHKVSANITIHPNERNLFENKVIKPLFNTTNVMEMGGQAYPILFENNKTLKVTFTLAHDLQHAYLKYIATGHGGWENGDEFVPKTHELYVDQQFVQKWIPWRVEC
ncbi:MAG TPA: PNGase F N-terminal domain-containing protein, partial [Flavobacterium sp.]|nr:PNGase F N-terminal domain-containing protein [Flavobacterium sp.]